MKIKLFDKKLFTEGLSQIKIPGIILLIICLFVTVIAPVSRGLEIAHAVDGQQLTFLKGPVGISEIAPVLLPFMYLAPMILTLMLFSFLNRRNASDFYHSLAIRRETVFFSYCLSILVFVFGTILLCVCVGAAGNAIIGRSVDFAYLPWLVGTFFAGSLLVMGCVLLAVSLTGTSFTNIILFGLILLLPRVIILMFTSSLSSATSILILKPSNLANDSCNIPVKMLFHYFGISQSSPTVSLLYRSTFALVYTLIAALVFFLIALLLFKKRKSEAAGSSAPNRFLQHAYRCTVALPFALAVPLVLTIQNSGDKTTVVVIFTFISLLAYLLYEFITTRSFKKMVRSIPVFSVVIALCLVFGLSLVAAKASILAFKPAASEIKGIGFTSADTNGQTTYYDLAADNILYADAETRTQVSGILNKNVETLQSGASLDRNFDARIVPVKIVLNSGRYAQRRLYLSADENEALTQCRLKNSAYRNLYLNLPDSKSIAAVNLYELTSSDAVNRIWESYKSEFASLPEDTRLSLTSPGDNMQNEKIVSGLGDTLTTITISGTLNMTNYLVNLPISSATPKTMKLYTDALNAQNLSAVKSTLNSDQDNRIQNLSLQFFGSSDQNQGKGGPSIDLNDCSSKDAAVQAIYSAIRDEMGQPVDPSKPYIYLNLFTDQGANIRLLLPLSDAAQAVLKQYSN